MNNRSTGVVSSASAALSLTDVGVEFGAVRALQSVDIEVAAGDIHAVIGPNGAGKSSLFNAVSGLYALSSGRIELHGDVISGLRPHRITALGVGRSFQNVSLAGTETVAESLMAGRHHLIGYGAWAGMLRTPRSRAEERRHLARVAEIADAIGIADLVARAAHELPYGRQKLVDIARAVCAEPRVLLLDEPAAGLDAQETAAVADAIFRVREALGLTVVLIEHDMNLVMGLADRVTVLDFGRVIAHGTPDEVQADPAVRDAYLGLDTAAVTQASSRSRGGGL